AGVASSVAIITEIPAGTQVIGKVGLDTGTNSIGKLGEVNTGIDIGDVGLKAGANSVGVLGRNPGIEIGDVRLNGGLPIPPGSRTNLALRSAELNDAVWTLTSGTITPNDDQGPTGPTTAERIAEATGTFWWGPSQSITLVDGVYTVSLSVKPNGRDWFLLEMWDGASALCDQYFNVTTGAIGGNVSANGIITILDVDMHPQPNGYHRCEVIIRIAGVTGDTIFALFTATADNSASGNAPAHAGSTGLGFFATDFQVEAAPFAGPYILTTTVAVTDGYTNLGTIGLEAGSNAVGNVGLEAGENYVGQTGGQIAQVIVSVAPAAVLYSVDDAIGGFTTFSNILRVNGGSGKIKSLTITDTQGIDADLELVIFSGTPTGTIADQTEYVLDPNDSFEVVGTISIAAADWKQYGTPSMVTKSEIGLGFINLDATRHLHM
ncbi:hypothetical protein LCGC14_2704000, partial [marine sediment metagenome]